ncbi:MAG: DNA polymerase III subunit delta' [Clostridia bacterium]|nr:DNA polymerase III subunit delta' [Clostridia bacterium]
MFDNILGNEKNKNILEKSIKLNKFSHSYIFWGIEGIGKKLIAKEFAKNILCLEQKENCNCKSCIEFDSNNNPDFQLIEPNEGKVRIEQVREMQRKIAEKPIISNKKIYIINDADTMTTEAQNCLLKTLEEPPEYITIILICTNEENLLSTIKSRCTRMHFDSIDTEEIRRYIKQNFPEQEISQNIIKLSQGSIGKTIKLNENKDIYENIEKILLNMQNKDLIEIVQMSEEIYKTKDEISSILDYMNVILLKLSKQNIKYIKCIDIVEQTKKRLKANSNYDMCIDNLLFNMIFIIHN